MGSSLWVHPAHHGFEPARAQKSTKGAIRPSRCFSVTSATTAPPQFEDFDVSNVISPNNCISEIIITNFLSFNKITLLNHILTVEHGKKIADIENEFGEIDLDGSLVAAKSVGVEDIMMLNNNCLCCIVNGDLVKMISKLVAKNK
ncbi:hypothetical protein JHK85_023871 [Glycine max]|nr:hypothetical protein JHK85_023871 [Glycine max]